MWRRTRLWQGIDPILVTGDVSDLAQQGQALTCLSPQTHDLTLYTSDSHSLAILNHQTAQQFTPSQSIGLEQSGPALAGATLPGTALPEIEFDGRGLSM